MIDRIENFELKEYGKLIINSEPKVTFLKRS
jgi:hypothetical protein